MESKSIRIRFGQAPGTFEAETEGFKGPACEKTMTEVMKNLGRVVDTQHTEDYYEDPDPQQEAHKQGGL